MEDALWGNFNFFIMIMGKYWANKKKYFEDIKLIFFLVDFFYCGLFFSRFLGHNCFENLFFIYIYIYIYIGIVEFKFIALFHNNYLLSLDQKNQLIFSICKIQTQIPYSRTHKKKSIKLIQNLEPTHAFFCNICVCVCVCFGIVPFNTLSSLFFEFVG